VGTPFLFHLIGADRDGRLSEFTAPLVFADTANDLSGFNDYVGASLAIRRRDMGGQLVAFADSSTPGNPPPSPTGKTSFNAATMTFSAGFFSPFIPSPPGQPQFYPILDPTTSAEVTIPALQQITGSSNAVPIVFYSDYLANNFKKGGVFLQLVNPLSVQFSGDQTGGLAKPNLNVGGLSRDFGTVSGTGAALDAFSGGRFDPKQYFGAISGAKLLGFIPLTDIIALIADVTGAPEKVPKVLTNRLPDRIVTTRMEAGRNELERRVCQCSISGRPVAAFGARRYRQHADRWRHA
jgi:hypothetical protein